MKKNLRLDHIGSHRANYERNRKRILAFQKYCGISGGEVDVHIIHVLNLYIDDRPKTP